MYLKYTDDRLMEYFVHIMKYDLTFHIQDITKKCIYHFITIKLRFIRLISIVYQILKIIQKISLCTYQDDCYLTFSLHWAHKRV